MTPSHQRIVPLYSTPVILGGGINGLGIARSFGEEGIKSIVLDTHKDHAFYSKYTTGLICPDPLSDERKFIEYLVHFGLTLKKKGFLITTSDKFLITTSKHQEILEKYYYYPMSSWNILENLINKEKLYTLADKIGIDTPITVKTSSIERIKDVISKLQFPIIVKPSITIGFTQAFGKKVLIINTYKQFDNFIIKLASTPFAHQPLIIQEYIPGSVARLYTITSYANRDHEIIAYSIGHKIRQDPPFAGTITSGKIQNVSEILRISQMLIRKAKFWGISNIEYKKDERNESYKLMEINPRSGVWNYSAKASGVNIPLISYEDYFHFTSGRQADNGKKITWISLVDDLSLSLSGFKKMGYPDESLSFHKWLYSIRGKKTFGILNAKDMKPFIKKLFSRFFKYFKV
ncbi:MAG: ATP-grasp domain-containing protein [Candidatus Cloacimonetes bacterium]|nr:ATP-grasp domain-containing protein [Candidatus Cloacimonadota bacterium]